MDKQRGVGGELFNKGWKEREYTAELYNGDKKRRRSGVRLMNY